MSLDYHGPCAFAALIVVLGCGKSEVSGSASNAEPATRVTEKPPAEQSDGPAVVCEVLEFEPVLDLPEASGAVPFDGVGLVVVGDSGHHGAYVVVDPETGKISERGRLPLGGARSDDIEGLTVARRGKKQRLIAINSGGLILELERADEGFVLVSEPYRFTPLDRDCSERSANCGRNWEGICLGDATAFPGCVGAAVSKRDGELVCLVRDAKGKLALNKDQRVSVARGKTLSGCSIDRSGTVWVSSNVLGANMLHSVDGETPSRHPILVAGSIEAIAVTDEVGGITLALFSDANRAPSTAFRYRCAPTL